MNAVDTNVFIYAIDSAEALKGPIAQSLLDRLDSEDTVLLWQVACEFSAVCTKLVQRGISTLDVADATQALRLRYPLILPDPTVLEAALQIRKDHGTSFWDALLLAGCLSSGVDTLYSEDFSEGFSHPRLTIVNPFRTK